MWVSVLRHLHVLDICVCIGGGRNGDLVYEVYVGVVKGCVGGVVRKWFDTDEEEGRVSGREESMGQLRMASLRSLGGSAETLLYGRDVLKHVCVSMCALGEGV